MVGVKNMNTLLAMYLIAIRDTVGWPMVTYVLLEWNRPCSNPLWDNTLWQRAARYLENFVFVGASYGGQRSHNCWCLAPEGLRLTITPHACLLTLSLLHASYWCTLTAPIATRAPGRCAPPGL